MLGLFAAAVAFSPLFSPAASHKGDCYIFVLKDCPIANQYAPEVTRIVKDYGSKGVKFTLVFEDTDVDSKGMTKHAQDFGYKLPLMKDEGHKLAKKMGVSVSPSAVIVLDSKVHYAGRIDDTYPAIGQRRAKVTSHDLRDALDAFLAGKPATVEKTEAVGCRLY